MFWKDTYRCSYPGDKGPNKTIFGIKWLSVGDMMDIDRGHDGSVAGPGTRMRKAIEKGLKSWSNFLGIISLDENFDIVEEVAFCEKWVAKIPPDVRAWLAHKIFEKSLISKALENALKNVVRTIDLKQKEDPNYPWNCDKCKEISGLQVRRKCPYLPEDHPTFKDNIPKMKYLLGYELKQVEQGKIPASVTYGGHRYEKCPVGDSIPGLTQEAYALYSMVVTFINDKTFPVWPPVVTEQPFFFMQAKSVIEIEHKRIEELKTKARDDGQPKKPVESPGVPDASNNPVAMKAELTEAQKAIMARAKARAKKAK